MQINHKIKLNMYTLKSKIHYLLLSMVITLCLTSCNEDAIVEKPLNTSEKTTTKSLEVNAVSTPNLARRDGYSRVADEIKNRYYSAYSTASRRSRNFVVNNPLSVGYYAAINATYNFSGSGSNDLLSNLCSYNSYHSTFYGYSSGEFRRFKRDIKGFMDNYNKPIVIYAYTQRWGSGNIRDNILTVWATSNDRVKVTRTSDSPNGVFGYNYIIELTWQQLFDKAIEASSHNVANVAFMDRY